MSVPSGAGSYDPRTDKPSVFWHECKAKDGFDDIRPGTQVVVKVGERTVGVGTLGAGRIRETFVCGFDFSFTVTEQAEFYDVAVGRRGAISVPRAGMGDVRVTVGL